MLPGTEIGAALTVLDAMQVDVVGLNCATGPVEMSEALRHLSGASRVPIACVPNAGLPSVVDGQMHYDLTPDGAGRAPAPLRHRVRRVRRRWVLRDHAGPPGRGGRALRRRRRPPPRTPVHEPAAASIYTSVPFRQDTSFLVVGERTNANGSKAFREAMLEGDWDTCVAMARDQVKEGSHLIDVCVDYTGADGVADMTEVASRLCTQSSVPLMVDSTEGPVVRAALEWIGGRPILNSVNLEEGDEPGTRLDTFLRLAREFGAAVVCTCIDEEGQARTAEWKLRGRPQHPRHRGRALRPRSPRTCSSTRWRCPCRRAWRRAAGDGIETIEGIRAHQGRAARRLHHPRALQRLLRPQPGGPPGAQLGLPARVRRGRPGLGHRARLEDPAAVAHRRAGQGDLPRPGLRPPRARATTPSRSCWRSSRGSRSTPARRTSTSTGRSTAGWPSASSTATATGSRTT